MVFAAAEYTSPVNFWCTFYRALITATWLMMAAVGYAVLACFLLGASSSGVSADSFLPPGPALHDVWVRRPFYSGDLVGVPSEGTAYIWNKEPNFMVDVCNTNGACSAGILRQGECAGATHHCNCLQWVGTLDQDVSVNVTVVPTYNTTCMRLICAENCTVKIDWLMVNSGTIIPNAVRNAAEMAQLDSPVWEHVPLSVFIYKYYYPSVCNPGAFSVACPSTSTIYLSRIVPTTKEIDPNTSVVVMAVSLGFCIMSVVFITRHRWAAHLTEGQTRPW